MCSVSSCLPSFRFNCNSSFFFTVLPSWCNNEWMNPSGFCVSRVEFVRNGTLVESKGGWIAIEWRRQVRLQQEPRPHCGIAITLEFDLRLHIVSGWLVVTHTYLYYYPLSLSLSPFVNKCHPVWNVNKWHKHWYSYRNNRMDNHSASRL